MKKVANLDAFRQGMEIIKLLENLTEDKVKGLLDHDFLKIFLNEADPTTLDHYELSEFLSRTRLRVTVDYSRRIESYVKESPCRMNFSYAFNSDDFPPLGSKKEEIVVRLVNFGVKVSTSSVLDLINPRQDQRLATWPELLSLVESYPRLQEHFPIIELGSTYVHHHLQKKQCLYAWLDEGDIRYPELGIYDFDQKEWFSICRFLVVEK